MDLTKYIEQHTFNFDDVFDMDSTNDYVNIFLVVHFILKILRFVYIDLPKNCTTACQVYIWWR